MKAEKKCIHVMQIEKGKQKNGVPKWKCKKCGETKYSM